MCRTPTALRLIPVCTSWVRKPPNRQGIGGVQKRGPQSRGRISLTLSMVAMQLTPLESKTWKVRPFPSHWNATQKKSLRITVEIQKYPAPSKFKSMIFGTPQNLPSRKNILQWGEKSINWSWHIIDIDVLLSSQGSHRCYYNCVAYV